MNIFNGKITVIAIISIITIGLSTSAIAATSTFSCQFEKYSSPEGLRNAKNFFLKFMLDTITNKAVLVGNNGIADVYIHQGSYGITFLEILKTGVVQSTTIASKTGQAVHSRHSLIGTDEIVPSQYYGNCKITQ